MCFWIKFISTLPPLNVGILQGPQELPTLFWGVLFAVIVRLTIKAPMLPDVMKPFECQALQLLSVQSPSSMPRSEDCQDFGLFGVYMGFRLQGLGLWVLGLGFWVLHTGLGFWVLEFT